MADVDKKSNPTLRARRVFARSRGWSKDLEWISMISFRFAQLCLDNGSFLGLYLEYLSERTQSCLTLLTMLSFFLYCSPLSLVPLRCVLFSTNRSINRQMDEAHKARRRYGSIFTGSSRWWQILIHMDDMSSCSRTIVCRGGISDVYSLQNHGDNRNEELDDRDARSRRRCLMMVSR